MSDTPETDEQVNGKPCTRFGILAGDSLKDALVPSSFARKLERERDDLQKAVNGLCEHIGVSPANTTLLAVELLRIERERDEAREALDRIARPVWWMQEDQKRKTGSINGISGGMALALSSDAEYLKGIAKSALKGETK